VEIWQFRCPECGFGHRELGHLLPDEEIYCVVCEDETRRHVKLLRWLTEEAADPTTRGADPAG
ncbi:MAG TPA: hypothetical protein VE690_23305, partial [Rhodopila sp.]|nr:hypothetical protein [Rhodopila sp.]